MFDKGLERLNEISSLLEKETTTLSQGVELFEESANIAKEMYKELNNTKGKITVIKQELDKFKEEGLDK